MTSVTTVTIAVLASDASMTHETVSEQRQARDRGVARPRGETIIRGGGAYVPSVAEET